MPRKYLVFLLFILVGCRPGQTEDKDLALTLPEPREIIEQGGLRLPVYDFGGLEPLLHRGDGGTYVVNFWATWCAPCLEELPYLEQVQMEDGDRGVQVILVSLDMPRMWDSRLLPFVLERRLKSLVVVLDDPNQNTWIPKVDTTWSGVIPATLIYTKEKREFYEGPLTYASLKKALSNIKI